MTTALVEGVRGLVAASQADDVAIGALDAVVDALDGPDRHGSR